MKKCCCAPTRHKPMPPQRDECPCCVEGMKDVLAQLNGKEVDIATLDQTGLGQGNNNFIVGAIVNDLIVTGTIPGSGQNKRSAAFPICNVVGVRGDVLKNIPLPAIDETCDCCERSITSFLQGIQGQTVDIDTLAGGQFNNIEGVKIDAVGKGTVRLTKTNETWIVSSCFISGIFGFTR
ncbi:hypothetical protein CS060_06575 [Anoxybacillus flavithermus]|uniref:Uncharacterized protein n=1 Tax=Anoxybacillus flavithermus TaxID=33934 RepID=A0A2G5RQS2_9BACL|nr:MULTISPECIES: hypothetical protein [Anoxybacillus]KFZ43432.1 hypothetical protein JS80_03440 [Anoxybacillus sp. KU2-6(11)]PIC05066.1 hypothetical protein CS060_06575 [Anoxybacillus flavithermus]